MKVDELYGELDSKEAYERAIDYFNNEANYCRIRRKENNIYYGTVVYANVEMFWKDGGEVNQKTQKQVGFKNSQLIDAMVSVEEKDRLSRIYSTSDLTFGKMSEAKDGNPFFGQALNSVSKREDIQILDITKEREGEDLIFELKLKIGNTFSNAKYYINQDGFVYKTYEAASTDENFENITIEMEQYFSDFNQKQGFDYDAEVQKLKDLEGESSQVIVDECVFD